MFQAFSLGNRSLKPIIGRSELGRALLDSHFQFIMRAPQRLFSTSAANKLTDFAANRSHRIQQIRVVLKRLRAKELDHPEEVPGALNGESYGADEPGTNRRHAAFE